MNILLIFPGFIIAFIIVFCYERKIRNLSAKIRNLSAKPINKVHFYVARDKGGEFYLYMDKPVRASNEFLASHHGRLIRAEKDFSKFGLNVHDFDNLTWEDEPIEVFLNMED